ncbi:MAG: protein-L-isoaspartate(D-aspartate) O-methyltransferase [Planctomycetes bacterium]|nr:protein-L-isoaspartate(D-aspartate) O-methyltransferase [Planctomycetota bacterium]
MMPDNRETDIEQRQQMVRHQLQGRGIVDERVLGVMSWLPRQHFIPEDLRGEAYRDQPVAIGWGQTISQPYIVALMTEKLQVESEHRVLEVGTGCGYQTAILSCLAGEVYTVERIRSLYEQARRNLGSFDFTNIAYQLGDGRRGWADDLGEAEEAGAVMFDRILVAAAAEDIPEGLVDQLAVGGKMVIPVGAENNQKLLLMEKYFDRKKQSKVKETLLCYCRFVRLVRDE